MIAHGLNLVDRNCFVQGRDGILNCGGEGSRGAAGGRVFPHRLADTGNTRTLAFRALGEYALAPRRSAMSSSQTSPASLQLVRAESQHVGEMGRICYEAFKDLHDCHRFPLDLPSAAVARQVLEMLVSRSDFCSVVALLDGQVVGSNFLSLSDPVAGIGPVTVEPCHHGKDIGRALMQDVVDHGRRRGIERIRLMQETINVGSLSLYASMGFDSREEVAYLQAAAAAAEDPSVRPVTDQDLP